MYGTPAPISVSRDRAATPRNPVGAALEASLRTTLETFYGHTEFRPGQLEVIAAAIAGQDTCVYWSTGSGKSLCYQLPALHTGKMTVVVSPLISLMQDQVRGAWLPPWGGPSRSHRQFE